MQYENSQNFPLFVLSVARPNSAPFPAYQREGNQTNLESNWNEPNPWIGFSSIQFGDRTKSNGNLKLYFKNECGLVLSCVSRCFEVIYQTRSARFWYGFSNSSTLSLRQHFHEFSLFSPLKRTFPPKMFCKKFSFKYSLDCNTEGSCFQILWYSPANGRWTVDDESFCFGFLVNFWGFFSHFSPSIRRMQ
jgi:hypothetical protein